MVTSLVGRRTVERALRQFAGEFDILHFVLPSMIPASLPFRVPLTATVWAFPTVRQVINDGPGRYSGPWAVLGTVADLQFLRTAGQGYRRSDFLIGTTSAGLARWSRMTGTTGEYVPLPVDIAQIDALRGPKLPADDGLRLILGERQLQRPRNNVGLLLRALELGGFTEGRVHLDLVGQASRSLLDRIARTRRAGIYIEHYPYLNFRDFIRLVNQADVVLSLRLIRDQGSYGLLESMTCHTAAIASDLPAFHDIVVPGSNGLLVPVDSAAGLQSSIESLLDNGDVLTKLKEGARSRIEHLHSLRAVGSAHRSVYEKIVG